MKNVFLILCIITFSQLSFGQNKTSIESQAAQDALSKVQNPEILYREASHSDTKKNSFSKEVKNYGNPPVANWLRDFGGDQSLAHVIGMVTDVNGNIYSYNYSSGAGDFFGVNVEEGTFISKQNTSGDVIWLKQFVGVNLDPGDIGDKLVIDPANEYIYITGGFLEDLIIPGESTLTPAAGGSVFVLKYNLHGEFIWAIQEDFTDENMTLTADYSGNIIVSGLFKNQINIQGIDLISQGDQDCFIAKYDANAILKYAIRAGGEDVEYIVATSVDANNNIYFTGEFISENVSVGSYDYNMSTGTGNIIFAKLNAKGDVLFVKSLAATNHEFYDDYCWPTGIITDEMGNSYLKGSFGPLANFDDILLENSYPSDTYNKFITRIDRNGDVLWARSINSHTIQYNFDYNQFDIDEEGSVYFGVQARDTVFFHNGYELYPSSPADLYMAKYTINGDLDWVTSFQGSTGGNNWISSVSVYNKSNIRVGGYYESNLSIDDESIFSSIQHGFITYFGNPINNIDVDFSFEINACENPAVFTDLSSSPNGAITEWNWNFGDPESGESNTSTEQNPSHLFIGNQTEFVIELGVKDAEGNSKTITKTIRPYPTTTIKGSVFTSEGLNIISGDVYAFVYSNGSLSENNETVAINEDGTYQFTDIPGCVDYILKAEANPENYNLIFPAYHFDAFYWNAATPVSGGWNDNFIENIDIQLYEFNPPPSGSSGVSGGVFYRNTKGEPVKNVDVVLEYDDPDAKTIVPVGTKKTGAFGQWSFDNLAVGTFRILVELPGLNADSVYTVTISEPNSNIGELNYYIDPERGIYTDETGIEEITSSSIGDIHLFPNPSNGSFAISIEKLSGLDYLDIRTLEIYNMNGQLMESINIDYKGERFTKIIDMNSFENGFYFIKVNSKNKSVVRKLGLMK